jgi:hypothetical protein
MAETDGETVMRVNVKPLTHWVIYKKYAVRFKERQPQSVTGILTTPGGAVPFTYDPQQKTIQLPDGIVAINEYGWEVHQEASSAS